MNAAEMLGLDKDKDTERMPMDRKGIVRDKALAVSALRNARCSLQLLAGAFIFAPSQALRGRKIGPKARNVLSILRLNHERAAVSIRSGGLHD